MILQGSVLQSGYALPGAGSRPLLTHCSTILRGVFTCVNPDPHRYQVRSPAGRKGEGERRGHDLFLLRKLHSFINSFNIYLLSFFSPKRYYLFLEREERREKERERNTDVREKH